LANEEVDVAVVRRSRALIGSNPKEGDGAGHAGLLRDLGELPVAVVARVLERVGRGHEADAVP
jgi:hypothetical protein